MIGKATIQKTNQGPPAVPGTARGPFPLVIGVTGHRDLRAEDVPALENRVREIFEKLQHSYPHTPLILLSTLEEGAGRLAARIALRCGVRLIASLPMPQELYRLEFTGPASQAEFDGLLAAAESWFELPLTAENPRPAVAGDRDAYRWQYAQAGAYLARESQILIALWDGLPCDDVGGTAQTVHFRMNGLRGRDCEQMASLKEAACDPLDQVGSGPVYHIVTPRVNSPSPSGDPLALSIVCRQAENASAAQAVYEQTYANIELFNQDAVRFETPLAVQRAEGRERLLPETEALSLPPAWQAIRKNFAAADSLAQYYQTRTLYTLGLLLGIVFLAAVLFELYSEIFDESGVLLLCYPLLLGVATVFWYLTARRSRWQEKYQDYRALAEGLRVEFFWRLAGLPDSVADNYLRKQRTELDWIRIAAGNACGTVTRKSAHTAPGAGHLPRVLTAWVKDQYDYFARAIPRDERQLERDERWVRVLFAIGPAAACLLGLMLVLPPGESVMEHLAHRPSPIGALSAGKALKYFLGIMIVLPAVLAASVHEYADKKALAQHVKQYKRMKLVFGNAAVSLDESLREQSYGKARTLLKELGQEALAENGDWVLTHRERPLDMPHE